MGIKNHIFSWIWIFLEDEIFQYVELLFLNFLILYFDFSEKQGKYNS